MFSFFFPFARILSFLVIFSFLLSLFFKKKKVRACGNAYFTGESVRRSGGTNNCDFVLDPFAEAREPHLTGFISLGPELFQSLADLEYIAMTTCQLPAYSFTQSCGSSGTLIVWYV